MQRTFAPVARDHLDVTVREGLREPVLLQVLDGPVDELRDVLDAHDRTRRPDEVVQHGGEVPRAATDVEHARARA